MTNASVIHYLFNIARNVLVYVASDIEQVMDYYGGNTPQGTNYTATCLPSRKISKLD